MFRRHKLATHHGVRIKLIFRSYDLDIGETIFSLCPHEDLTLFELNSDEMYFMAKYSSPDGICYPLGGELTKQGFSIEPTMLTPIGGAGKFLVLEVEAMELP